MGDEREPSIFRGALAGYAIASAIGVAVIVCLIASAGKYEAAGGLDLLMGVGAAGVIAGYQVAVRRRKARGIRGPLDEWAKFITSKVAIGIAGIVIAGSFLIAVVVLLAYKAMRGV